MKSWWYPVGCIGFLSAYILSKILKGIYSKVTISPTVSTLKIHFRRKVPFLCIFCLKIIIPPCCTQGHLD